MISLIILALNLMKYRLGPFLKLSFILCLLLLMIHRSSSTSNFCGIEDHVCPENAKHIGCEENKFEINNKCLNISLYKLTTDDIRDILNFHNEKRNIIAGGQLHNFEGATKMRKMIWDEELAELAENHAQLCFSKFDDCHGTRTFPYAGQIFTTHTTAQKIDVKIAINSILNENFDEYKNMDMSLIFNYDPHKTSKLTGKFAMIARDQNGSVGCGFITYKIYENGIKYGNMLTCNYAMSNFMNMPVYKNGVPGAECSNISPGLWEKSTEYSNLCENDIEMAKFTLLHSDVNEYSSGTKININIALVGILFYTYLLFINIY